MAYMSQDKKKAIVAKLKDVIPQDWKWTVSVENHSTLNLNIAAAPIDLIGELRMYSDPEYFKYHFPNEKPGEGRMTYIDLNTYYLDNAYKGELLKIFENIKAAMMSGNHDNSDIMTDYFDVGWYIGIKLGKWNKPFVVK